jgi:hypothetical protein
MLKEVSTHLKQFEIICRRDLMGIEQTDNEVNSPIQTTVPIWVDQILNVADETRRFIRRECPRIGAVCRPSGVLSSDLYGRTVILYYGIFDMRIFEGGDVLFQAAHTLETEFFQTPKQVESKYEITWKASRTAPIMSALAEAAVNELLEAWSSKFRQAIERFTELVENAKMESN